MEQELETTTKTTRTNESSTYALTTGSNVLYETAPAQCLDLVHTEQQQQAAAQQQMTEQMASGSDSVLWNKMVKIIEQEDVVQVIFKTATGKTITLDAEASDTKDDEAMDAKASDTKDDEAMDAKASDTIAKVHFQALSGNKFTLNLPLDFSRYALQIGEAVSHKLAMSTSLFSLVLGDTHLDMYKSISNLGISDGSVINIIFHDPIDDDDDDDTDKIWHTYQYIHQGKAIWTGVFWGWRRDHVGYARRAGMLMALG